MAQNLRARLSRIRKTQKQEASHPPETSPRTCERVDEQIQHGVGPANASFTRKSLGPQSTKTQSGQKAEGWGVIPPGFSTWQEAGYKVLRRTLTLPFKLPAVLPETLPALVPDLTAVPLDPGRFLFFDLETTGLSGGAGTVAFLAAFGRFVRDTGIEITQFLLLDYPGEPDFLERVLSLISPPVAETPYFLTTYNGKAYDTQILKTRCLLNGFPIPPFLQADLLHPARRLWKRLLPNCSQATIETMVLGLDRTGDTPGSLAPDIWFNFLRSGGDLAGTGQDMPEPCQALLGICDHNIKDIVGLASLFRAFAEIAVVPLDAAARFHCDEENLALSWRRLARNSVNGDDRVETDDQAKTAALLLEAAAAQYPRACLRLGFDRMRQGRHEEGRAALQRLAAMSEEWKVSRSITVQALALRSLAIDAKRRLGRKDMALAYIEKALALEQPADTAAPQKLPHGLREDLEKRREGIEKEMES